MSDSLEVTDAASAAVAIAPRVTLDSIKAKVADTRYLIIEPLTICILTMANGFFVVGKAAPASPENFNAQLGRQFAYEDCIRQIWTLEGYLLRDALHSESGK